MVKPVTSSLAYSLPFKGKCFALGLVIPGIFAAGVMAQFNPYNPMVLTSPLTTKPVSDTSLRTGSPFGVTGALPPLLTSTLPKAPSYTGPTRFHIESAEVGSRTITVVLDDSIQSPDLASLQVEGYDIEQSVFVEESDSLTLSPTLIDLTLKGSPRIREVIPTQNQLILDAPLYFVPVPGSVLADTAFGGVLVRVLSAEAQGPALSTLRKYLITYEPAKLDEVFLSGEIRFKSRMDLTVSPQDADEEGEAPGQISSSDSTPISVHSQFGWKDAHLIFRPELTGRIQMQNGQWLRTDFSVRGDAEAAGKFWARYEGQGLFAVDRELPNIRRVGIPLGHGLQIVAQHKPIFSSRAEARDSLLSGQVGFRLSQNWVGRFPSGEAPPWADAKLNSDLQPGPPMEGLGLLRFQLTSQFEIQSGQDWLARLTLSNEARLNQTINLEDTLALKKIQGLPLVALGNDPPSLNTVQSNPRREIRLGNSLSWERPAQSNALAQGWLLYNRELPLLAPPDVMHAQLISIEPGKFLINAVAATKPDYWKVQAKVGEGLWETVIDKSLVPRIRLPAFKTETAGFWGKHESFDPRSEMPVRIRVIAVNGMGQSLPWPLEGLLLPSTSPNHAPLTPMALLPDSGAVADTSLRLSWRATDPDSGSHLFYTVFLDTRNPPVTLKADGLSDSTLMISQLAPGTQYFWRVRASDGFDTADSPVQHFQTRPAQNALPPPTLLPRVGNGNPWVLVPRGQFLREDGLVIAAGPILLQKYEVIQSDFLRLMGNNPSYRIGDSLPVERVTWDEADAYCKAAGGRLPSEAEWELAARGGNKEKAWINSSPEQYAWFRTNSENHTRKVGLLKPNGFGLYDMAGNVFEWVSDWYGPYAPDVVNNPHGPSQGKAKVMRGASWFSEVTSLDPAARFFNRPSYRNYKVGLRCAEDFPSEVRAASAGPR